MRALGLGARAARDQRATGLEENGMEDGIEFRSPARAIAYILCRCIITIMLDGKYHILFYDLYQAKDFVSGAVSFPLSITSHLRSKITTLAFCSPAQFLTARTHAFIMLCAYALEWKPQALHMCTSYIMFYVCVCSVRGSIMSAFMCSRGVRACVRWAHRNHLTHTNMLELCCV